jgi:hypothetical protein
VIRLSSSTSHPRNFRIERGVIARGVDGPITETGAFERWTIETSIDVAPGQIDFVLQKLWEKCKSRVRATGPNGQQRCIEDPGSIMAQVGGD